MATDRSMLFSWDDVERLPELRRLEFVLENLPDGDVVAALEAKRGRRLEAAFEAGLRRRAHLAEEVGHGGVAARVAEIRDVAPQAATGQPLVFGDPLAQIVLVGVEQPRSRLPGSVVRGLQPLFEVLAHSLAVETGPAGDGGCAQPLTPQIVDHDYLPQDDHPHLPWRRTRDHRTRSPATGRIGEFSIGTFGEYYSGTDSLNAAGSAVSRRTDPGRGTPLPGARSDPVQMRTVHICAVGITPAGARRTPAATVRGPETNLARCRPPEKKPQRKSLNKARSCQAARQVVRWACESERIRSAGRVAPI